MIPIFNPLINKPFRSAPWLVLFAMSVWMGPGGALADWRTPVMSDYVKVPVFSSYAAKPNIMIILDNSRSMNELAYSGGYTGGPYNGTIRSFPVNRGQDDMEENSIGDLRDGSDGDNDLDFQRDFIGLRFERVDIPQGATITSARIEFTAKTTSTGGQADLEIKGEASDDAAPLKEDENGNISKRAVTAATVSWTPGDWVAGDHYDTPDLTPIVQEIVNRQGWAPPDKAMLFRINPPGFPGTTTEHREAWSNENGLNTAPVLHVTYIGKAAETRYYGYFNPDYFYSNSSNAFSPEYKKVQYDPLSNSWRVEDLSGSGTILTDSDIAPADPADGLWDGNWMNWLCMRRVDVLRKVLMGGRRTSRIGGGNRQNEGEPQVPDVYNNWYELPKYFNSADGPATSPYKGGYEYTITLKGEISVVNTLYDIEINKDINIEPEDFFWDQEEKKDNLAGVLQRIGDRARWGNMWFNEGEGAGKSGGAVQNTIDNGFSTNFLPDIGTQKCDTYTPLAETLYVATQYFAQEPVASGLDYPNQADLFNIKKNSLKDPYWDRAEAVSVPCAKSFVLLLTDGASTKDSNIPDDLKDFDKDGTDDTNCDESTGSNCDYSTGGTDYLDDVALYARTTDLRDDLDGPQNVLLYTVFAFDDDPNARSLLQDAAKNGGFEDLDGDNRPNLQAEWDKDNDNIPDTYFEASDGYALERELLAAINDILRRASSGTAASVVSNSRSGEGAIYQSIFYPATTEGANTAKWVGQVHSLLSDARGNIREDTNGNKKLDLADDLFIVFGDETLNSNADCSFDDTNEGPLTINKYKDSNADGIFDDTDEGPLTIGTQKEFKLSEINFLWSSNDWLNELTDPVTQRPYTSTARQRHIFTFVDADGDMVADSAEVKDFTATVDPAWSDVVDPANYYAYIHAFNTPFAVPPPIDPAHADFESVVSRKIRRVINFTRGQDQGCEKIGSTELSSLRNRIIDYDGDGVDETWRLGDIVYSTPTVVGPPSEEFDLIYRDKGYSAFFMRYKNRRNVLYVGSNDGMIHAFSSGFFDAANNAFVTEPVDKQGQAITDGGPYRAFDIGAELWAYVPFNLLSHLHWLTDPDYEHIYFNDLQPRIFDARVYPDKGADDPTHPNGWATLMVCGMRFGGGKIAADIDKKDGAYNATIDKAMSSAYAIFDITNPEEAPILLGEVTFPELGFTTCHPGVVPMRDFDEDHQEQTNQWYLIFGSGPITADGAGTSALINGTSTRQAVMYAIDLVALAADKKLVTLTNTGKKTYTAAAAADPYYLVQFNESNSIVSKPIAVDWDLDFNTDSAYFGIVYGDPTNGWNGKLRRLVMDNGADPLVPTNWTLDSTLLDLTDGNHSDLANGQPVVASATAGTDKADDRWLFFGTGRFYSQEDKSNMDQQSYYGVKEPYTEVNSVKNFDYSQVNFGDLMDVTDIKVYENGNYISGFTGGETFKDLANYIEDHQQGWRLNFDCKLGDRNLGQAVLAGDVLTFTTYIPSEDPCTISGNSLVYALYYRTGTAYIHPIIGMDDTDTHNENALVLKRTHLGMGMTVTPNIHVGREQGSQAYIQTSTGSIKPIEEKNPGVIKSGRIPVKPADQTCP